MSQNSNLDFDDFGDLDEPFADTDNDLMPPDEPRPSGQRNTRFFLIAVLLVILFLIGIGGLVGVILWQRDIAIADGQTRTSIAQTNEAVQVAINATNTAKAWSPTPSPTLTPTDTPTPTPSPSPTETPTPSPSPSETATPTMVATAANDLDATRTAIAGANQTATCRAGGCATTPPLATTAVAQNPSATQPFGTGGPASNTPTPTKVVPAVATCRPGEGPTAKLPCTGFFEDLSGGNPANIGLVALAAVALLGVIVVSRRLRVA